MKKPNITKEIIIAAISVTIVFVAIFYLSKYHHSSIDPNNSIKVTSEKKPVKIIIKKIFRPSQPVSVYIDHIETELQQLINELITKKTTSPICQQRRQTKVWRYGKDNMRGATILERKDSFDDSRGIGVVWCVVGLLIISVIASLFDILNARSKAPKLKKTSSTDIAGNPAAARRCSLTTSNVAKHAKRQLFGSRRSATIAGGLPTKSFYSGPPAGRRDSTWIRSSSPSSPTDGFGSRRESVVTPLGTLGDSEDDSSPDRLHKRIRIIRRF